MSTSSVGGNTPPENPRPVSRGLNLQRVFIGIDSLYLVLEYPHADVYEKWFGRVSERQEVWLRQGVAFEDFVIRRGANGYALSVWDGDARLFLTDRVDDALQGTAQQGQGMGLMLQLGPIWLRRFGELRFTERFKSELMAQFVIFGVPEPHNYRVRVNRLDIAVDLLGLPVASLSMQEWQDGWVGFARKKHFYTSDRSGELEGFSIGSSEGAVRFKVYDKVKESLTVGKSAFWRSVWDVGESEAIDVARFEWSTRPYAAEFAGRRYLDELTETAVFDVLNYLMFWGSLCVPTEDSNRSRWPLHPLWEALGELIADARAQASERVLREYAMKPDLKPAYLRSVAGWLAGYMARVGVAEGLDSASSLKNALDALADQDISYLQKAAAKWEVLMRLAGGRC
ncbi:MAG: hypothetical protein U0452_05570 [Anaerolineae bacterium]